MMQMTEASTRLQDPVAPSGNVSISSYPEYNLSLEVWRVGSPLLLIVGTVGNVLSILVLTRSSLRKLTTMFYLAVLAFADLAVLYTGLLRLWMDNVFGFYIRLQSNAACKLHMFLVYFSLDFSVWVLVAVTVDRCLYVSAPFTARRWCSLRQARIVVTVIAAVLFVVNMHYFWTVSITYHGSKSIAGDESYSCYSSDNRQMAFFVEKVWPWIDLCVVCLIPFIIMVICNSLIIRQLVVSTKNLLKHTEHRANTANEMVTAQKCDNVNRTGSLLDISGKNVEQQTPGAYDETMMSRTSKPEQQSIQSPCHPVFGSEGGARHQACLTCCNGTDSPHQTADSYTVDQHALQGENTRDVSFKEESTVSTDSEAGATHSHQKQTSTQELTAHQNTEFSETFHKTGTLLNTENGSLSDPVRQLDQSRTQLHNGGLTSPQNQQLCGIHTPPLQNDHNQNQNQSIFQSLHHCEQDRTKNDVQKQQQQHVQSSSLQYRPKSRRGRRFRHISESVNQKRGIPSVTVMLLTVNSLFWLLTAPVVVFVIGYAYWRRTASARGEAQLSLGWSLVNMLQYTNNVIHFFLYCLTGPRFRQELATICRKSPKRQVRVQSSAN